MEVTLKQFFNIGDGRLSTEMGDVYKMLNYIFDADLFTHELPWAMRKLESVNPEWFQKGKSVIKDIKVTNNTDDFGTLIKLIDECFPMYKVKLGKIKT